MSDLLGGIKDALGQLDARSVFDILLIAAIFYWLLLLLRGTTAMSLLRGFAILLIAAVILARLLDLRVLNFLLRNSLIGLAVAIPIVFQPELRRALERVGRAGVRAWLGRPGYDILIDVVAGAALGLAEHRHGALMVLERDTGLQDYIDTGIRVDAAPSAELLEGIFFPRSPLHDGAVILRENRVVAAACTLPLSEDPSGGRMGLRHRAAVGITERTDAITVVVSEETGEIALAANGRLVPRLDETRLRATLSSLLSQPEPTARDGRGSPGAGE
jgi:diadenylate cyclase